MRGTRARGLVLRAVVEAQLAQGRRTSSDRFSVDDPPLAALISTRGAISFGPTRIRALCRFVLTAVLTLSVGPTRPRRVSDLGH
jgi:hypothetical protein